MNFLHTLASVTALLTMLLFLARQHCGLTKLAVLSMYEQGNTKSGVKSNGSAAECRMLYRSPVLSGDNISSGSSKPKYKRDPDIQIDDESISVHPRESKHIT